MAFRRRCAHVGIAWLLVLVAVARLWVEQEEGDEVGDLPSQEDEEEERKKREMIQRKGRRGSVSSESVQNGDMKDVKFPSYDKVWNNYSHATANDTDSITDESTSLCAGSRCRVSSQWSAGGGLLVPALQGAVRPAMQAVFAKAVFVV